MTRHVARLSRTTMKNSTKCERSVAVGGLIALGISALPWFGAGHGTFIETYGHHLLPRLKLLPPNGLGLYDLAAIPLHLLAIVPGFEYAIYFSREGRAEVRPFVFFLFWACIGLAVLWTGIRGKVLRLDGKASA